MDDITNKLIVSYDNTQNWFFRPKPVKNPRLRLFFFPHLGGIAQVFKDWPTSLPEDIEIYILQMPGRPPREHEPSIKRFSELIEAIKNAILPLLNVSFIFLGHSFGGMVAFEVAQQLRRNNQPQPIKLILSSIEPPSIVIHYFTTWLQTDVQRFIRWRYVAEAPLDIPIISFGGSMLWPIAAEALAGWKQQTNSTYQLKLVPGNTDRIFQTSFIKIVADTINDFMVSTQLTTISPNAVSSMTEKSSSDHNSSLWWCRLRPQSRPALRLFCLGRESDLPGYYACWPDIFPDNVEICVLQIPGRPPRTAEKSPKTIAEILAAAEQEMLPLLNVPYALFGGLLAFEMARHLRRANHPSPRLLMVSRLEPPQNINLTGFMKADIELFITYRYIEEEALDVPIHIWSGDKDNSMPETWLKAWQQETTAEFSYKKFSGGHFYMQTNKKEFFDALKEELVFKTPAVEIPAA